MSTKIRSNHEESPRRYPNSKITAEQAVQIRELFSERRKRDLKLPVSQRTSLPSLAEQIAWVMGLDVSSTSILRIVKGVTFKHAGGPLDTDVAVRHQTLKVLKGTASEEDLHAARNILPTVPMGSLVVVVTEPGKEPRRFTYPAGTTVTIETHVGQPSASDET